MWPCQRGIPTGRTEKNLIDMKRKKFLSSLGLIAGAAFIPESKPERLKITHSGYEGIGVERMRITSNGTHLFMQSSGNVGMGILNPKQILTVNN